jgi:hypothetical protein
MNKNWLFPFLSLTEILNIELLISSVLMKAERKPWERDLATPSADL